MTMLMLRVVPIDEVSIRGPVSSVGLLRSLPLAITLARIPLLIGMGIAYTAGAPWAAVAMLAAFIIIDIMDGDVARALHVETATRRLLDGVIDRLGVHAIVALVCLSVENLWVVWGFLIARDGLQAVVGAQVLLRRRVVAAGAPWHRAYTLSIALWGSIVMVSASVAWLAALPVVVTGVATLVDYIRQANSVTEPLVTQQLSQPGL